MVTTWTADVQLIVTTWTVDVQLIVTTWTADSADGNYMFLNIPDLILNIRIKCDRPMNEPTKQHANRTSQLLNTIWSDIYIYISLWWNFKIDDAMEKNPSEFFILCENECPEQKCARHSTIFIFSNALLHKENTRYIRVKQQSRFRMNMYMLRMF